MGIYIDLPAGVSLEYFLAANGIKATSQDMESLVDDPIRVGVCVIDNGFYYAPGIVFDQKEVKKYNSPHDTRPRKYYSVLRSSLKEIGIEF